jgi:hypothetical protein
MDKEVIEAVVEILNQGSQPLKNAAMCMENFVDASNEELYRCIRTHVCGGMFTLEPTDKILLHRVGSLLMVDPRSFVE